MSYFTPLIFLNLTRYEETVGIDSQAACLMDGLTDDYECYHGEHPETQRKGKGTMYVSVSWNSSVEVSHTLLRKYQTESAATAGSCEVVVLMSGAWKT